MNLAKSGLNAICFRLCEDRSPVSQSLSQLVGRSVGGSHFEHSIGWLFVGWLTGWLWLVRRRRLRLSFLLFFIYLMFESNLDSNYRTLTLQLPLSHFTLENYSLPISRELWAFWGTKLDFSAKVCCSWRPIAISFGLRFIPAPFKSIHSRTQEKKILLAHKTLEDIQRHIISAGHRH